MGLSDHSPESCSIVLSRVTDRKKKRKENELDRLQWNEAKTEIQWTVAIYLQQWTYSALQALGSPISFSSAH